MGVGTSFTLRPTVPMGHMTGVPHVCALGVARETKHAADVTERVKALASENNTLLGHFLCQGSIDLNRTAQRLKIPEGEKGHLSQERFERQKLSLGHPDEKDLADAREAVRGFFAKR